MSSQYELTRHLPTLFIYSQPMRQLHEIQLQVLQKLLFAESLRYTEMKPDKLMENNQFQFHLTQLVDYGYVLKSGKHYTLTSTGKEYANRIDSEVVKIERQAKISVWIACTRKRKGKLQLLMYTRLKQPFYGCQGFPSGKVKYGEKISEAAIRELKEETNLDANKSQTVAIAHFRVFDENTMDLLEDKFMHLCLIKNPVGVIQANHEGKYEWINEEDLDSYLTNPFEDKNEYHYYIHFIKNFNGNVKLIESDHKTSKF